MCEVASKQTPDLKIPTPNPRFEIPGSATDMYIENVEYNCGLCSGGPYADIIRIFITAPGWDVLWKPCCW